MNRTSILLTEKKQVTSDLFEYKLKVSSETKSSLISIIAHNDMDFKIYLKDLQYIIVDTDACMAFDDNEILSKIKLAQ